MGLKQFHTYKDALENAFSALAENPNIVNSKSRDELFLDCRSYAIGKHITFYRTRNNTLEIVRILHQRMDIESYF